MCDSTHVNEKERQREYKKQEKRNIRKHKTVIDSSYTTAKHGTFHILKFTWTRTGTSEMEKK